MGAPLTEFVIETVIRDGLGELRATPNKLDDIFSKFLEAQFNNQYGQNKINSIKTYIQNNQIKIVHAWQQVPTSSPCISIQLMRANEEEDIQNLGNDYLEEDRSTTPTVYVPVADPGTYDTLTGKLTIINAADLSVVCPGMVFVDSTNQKFPISSPISNLSGNKYISIGSGKNPSLVAGGRIESSIDFIRSDRRMIRIRETIMLGCHANNDMHLAKFIYYILVYILKSRQQSLITRGINLDRGTGNVFDRDDEFQGENIFSRFLEVNCLTEFIWNQGDVQVFDCFHLDVKTNKPNPDSPVAEKYNTSPED
jgi:hypothetical protein